MPETGSERAEPRILSGHGRMKRFLPPFAILVVLTGLVLLWNYSPLARWANPEALAEAVTAMRDRWWIYPLILFGYVAGGLLLFPLTVLVAMTGLVLGPTKGFLVAMTGSLASGWVGFGIGAVTGGHGLEKISRRAHRVVSRALENHGVLAVAALRMVPLAPYAIVNVAMGATDLASRVFLAGTFLGLLPGILVLTMLGDRLREAWRDPEPANVALLLLFIALWLVLAFVLQRLVSWRRRRDGQGHT